MLKFGRNYRLHVKVGKLVKKDNKNFTQWDEEFDITYPITINFQITRAAWSNINTANFELYNLSDDTRTKLYRDRYPSNPPKIIRVEFYAGYGTDTQNLPLCFAGDVFDGYSDKRGGDPNIKTVLTCGVGVISYQTSFINQTFAADTKPLDIVKTLCNAAGLELGNPDSSVIASMGNLKKAWAAVGSAIDKLKEFVGENYVKIDGYRGVDKVWILKEGETLPPKEYYLTIDETGIFGTPKRRDMCLTVEMLFEPRLMENQEIELNSRTAPYFNGKYKVVGFNHLGTISGSIGGNCRTTALLSVIGKNYNALTTI